MSEAGPARNPATFPRLSITTMVGSVSTSKRRLVSSSWTWSSIIPRSLAIFSASGAFPNSSATTFPASCSRVHVLPSRSLASNAGRGTAAHFGPGKLIRQLDQIGRRRLLYKTDHAVNPAAIEFPNVSGCFEKLDYRVLLARVVEILRQRHIGLKSRVSDRGRHCDRSH